jgi:hypothetical protein
LEEIVPVVADSMMLNEDGGSSWTSASRVVPVVDYEVGLRYKHHVCEYVMSKKEHFELFFMVCEAVGVPNGESQEFSHHYSLLRTAVKRFRILPGCVKSLFVMAFKSCI